MGFYKKYKKSNKRKTMTYKKYKKAKLVKQIGGKEYGYTFSLPSQYFTNTSVAGVPAMQGTGPISLASFSSGVSGFFANTYSFGFGWYSQLDDFANYTSYTSLYDQYKITKVDMVVEFLSNLTNVQGVGILPDIYYVSDSDNATAPVRQTDLTAIGGHKTLKVGDKNKLSFKFSWIPKVAYQVYNATSMAVTPGYATLGGKNQEWIDCATPGVAGYGFKMWLENYNLASNSGGSQSGIRFQLTYHVKFRKPILEG